MNDYKNFCEYSYVPESGARLKVAQIGLVCLYTAFTLLYLIIFWGLFRALALVIMLPFILLAIIKVTWKYTDKEYEILVEAGEMTVAAIYGGVTRRVKKRIYIPEMTLIAKYTESRVAMVKGGGVSEVSNYGGSTDGENSFVCVYPDTKQGKKCAVIIDTNDELRRILRLCNPAAFQRE